MKQKLNTRRTILCNLTHTYTHTGWVKVSSARQGEQFDEHTAAKKKTGKKGNQTFENGISSSNANCMQRCETDGAPALSPASLQKPHPANRFLTLAEPHELNKNLYLQQRLFISPTPGLSPCRLGSSNLHFVFFFNFLFLFLKNVISCLHSKMLIAKEKLYDALINQWINR